MENKYHILVNKQNPLPDSFVPDNLVKINEPTGIKADPNYKNMLDREVYSAFKSMQAYALAEGLEIFVDSSYRSYEYQMKVIEDIKARKGEEHVSKYCAPVGTSEHQTGLAFDVIPRRNGEMIENLKKEEPFDPEIVWLMENAHKFGFILRYPKGKESITGYNFEPWHFRYVGLDLSLELYENKETLEEYYQRIHSNRVV